MNAFENSPTKIYVAPDGSRIKGGPGQGSGIHQARPVATPTYGSTSSPRAPGNSSGSGFGGYGGVYGAAPSPITHSVPAQINVGLLAWGVILVIFGTLLVFTPVFGAGTLQTLVVITFAAAGIAFLALAYLTSKNDRPGKAPTTD